MKLVTRWTRAADAIRWLTHNFRKANLAEMEAGILIGRLEGLGPDPHPDKVDALVGHLGLTDPGWCRVCVENCDELVQLWGDDDDKYRVCAKCLLAAMQLIEP